MKAILHKGKPAFLHFAFILLFIPTILITLAHAGEPNLVPLGNPLLKELCSISLAASILFILVTFIAETPLRSRITVRSR